MKAADVVAQLAVLLPQRSGLFTSNVDVKSLTRSGTVMTATCEDQHGLVVGNAVAIVGAVTQITVSSLTRSDTVET